MGTFSFWHWIVVLLVVVLLFGTRKLRDVGGDLGAAIRSFKKGLNEEPDEASGRLPGGSTERDKTGSGQDGGEGR
ncbi:MAG: hypothetical protein KatS3mg126_0860 [Lysobacteraceae bacterium]|nr:MAG: hypothetical protein KatS3mg126_0860 [Xanthomonadaceae bacterium]